MTEEENFKAKYKNLISTVQKIIECSVCLYTLKVPFKTCSRGHGVCTVCCLSSKKCPMCGDPFTAENPTCLKNLLEALPRMCRHSDGGCEEIVEQRNDHEGFCGYRPFVCQYAYCGDKVPIMKLMDHYKADHPDCLVCKTQTQSINWPTFDPKSTRSEHILVLLFNNTFWFSPTNDIKRKFLKFTFKATPIGKLNKNYFARVKFEKDDFICQSTIKASVSSTCNIEDDTASDNDEDEVGSDTEEYCMKIPLSVLRKFIDKEGKLQYEVFFFEEAK